MVQILQVAAIAVATLGTGAATMSVLSGDVADFEPPAGDWRASDALDGLSFKITGAVLGDDDVFTDVQHFRAQGFLSEECQTYCDFGWSDYEVMEDGDAIHFKATAICPDAPHTVVYYGIIEGDEMALTGTWTTRRWYWTHQITVEAAGRAVDVTEIDTGVAS